MVGGAMALFLLQSMEPNFVKVQGKENLEKLWGFFTVARTIMIYLFEAGGAIW